LVRERFKLNLEQASSTGSGDGAEAISHSDRLALVNDGKVVGLYDSTEARAVDELIARARRSALPLWYQSLPTVNAGLNALCAVFLIMGWIMIRGRDMSRNESPAQRPNGQALLTQPLVRAHVVLMLLAVASSALFLLSYLVYHYQVGSVPFRGAGSVRWLYFTILLSHTILATFGVIPLVSATVAQALRGRFATHLRLARVTLPIWLYVSVTGVVIYVMLYHSCI
jgi:protein SCO1/2/putative membrane protein